MGAALKERPLTVTVALTGKSQAELLCMLAEEIGIERSSPNARAIYDALLSSFAVADFAGTLRNSRWRNVRSAGPEARRSKSIQMRMDWKAEATRLIVEALGNGKHFPREEIISGIKRYSFGRYDGIGIKGRQVQTSTIEHWLTKAVEAEIRQLAAEECSQLLAGS